MTLAQRYIELDVTTPAGTAKAAAITTKTGIVNAVVNEIELLIPPGHQGLTGISVQWNGVGLVPFSQPPAFVVGDDYERAFTIGEQIGGGLVVVTYNTDTVFPHTHYLRFNVTPFSLSSSSTPSSVAPVPIA